MRRRRRRRDATRRESERVQVVSEREEKRSGKKSVEYKLGTSRSDLFYQNEEKNCAASRDIYTLWYKNSLFSSLYKKHQQYDRETSKRVRT